MFCLRRKVGPSMDATPGLSPLSTPTSPTRVSWAGTFQDAHGDGKGHVYVQRLFWKSRVGAEP